MKNQDFTNHFLIATEKTSNSLFANSVVYVCRHDESGTFGIIINKPSKTSVTELLASMKIQNIRGKRQMIMQGGPVKQEQVFILHSPPDEYDVTMKVGDDIGMTLSRDILTAISENRAPEKMLFACGYAGWENGQLEAEVMDNAWIVIPASSDIMFNLPPEMRLNEATKRFGFDFKNFSGASGHA